MKRAPDSLLRMVESFFRDYLQRVRGASRHTVFAYRDALRLFFAFLADSKKRPVADLRADDLTVDRVLAFLDHLEADRRNTIATRNLRLTTIRSFFRHLIRDDPTRAAQYQRVLSLPLKKTRPPLLTYLEPEEIQILLRQPDRRTRHGARDFALLLFLYNTGARISEALFLQWRDLHLVRPRQVKLHGKGRKDRICPLWPNTTAALKYLAYGTEPPPEAFVFRSARGERLSRDGAAYLIEKYLRLARHHMPTLSRKHVTPHVMRHSCAVALLQAGVDLTVIRDYLGHESVATTGRYTKTNLQMKRRVLDAFWRRAGLTRTRDPRWRPNPDLLAYLASL
jgi:site-specific recombinase XerD